MNGYYSKQPRFWRGLSLAIGLTGALLVWPVGAIAQDGASERARQESTKQESNQKKGARARSKQEGRPEQPLSWARIDYILNDVELVPRRARARTARVADVLGIGDALRTLSAANAELRFNDGSEVRIGELATFRFTPNTRNFQLSDGTALFLIPPKKGRTTIQTPNAVTGIQGSALFVRYIEETDTTIVGALTDNPDGPMILYTEDGAQEQALYSNQVGVVEGDRITEVYDLDAQMFWETSGLAETFDYTEDAGAADELDGVRQEIRDAIDSQGEFDGSDIVENPEKFSRPDAGAQAPVDDAEEDSVEAPADSGEENESADTETEDNRQSDDPSTNDDASEEEVDLIIDVEDADEVEEEIQYEGSPAEEFHNQNKQPAPSENGVNPSPSATLTDTEGEENEDEEVSAGNNDASGGSTSQSENNANNSGGGDRPGANRPNVTVEQPTGDRPATTIDAPDDDLLVDESGLPVVPDNETPEILAPPNVAGENNRPNPTPIAQPDPVTQPNPAPVAQPNEPTEGIVPLPPAALTENEDTEDEMEDESDASTEENVSNDGVSPSVEDSEDDDASTEGNSSGEDTPPTEDSDAESNSPDPTTGNSSDSSDDDGGVDPVSGSTEDVEPEAPSDIENSTDVEESTGVEESEDSSLIVEDETETSNEGEAEAVEIEAEPSTEAEDSEDSSLVVEDEATLNNEAEAEAVEIDSSNPVEESVENTVAGPDEDIDENLVVPAEEAAEPVVEDTVEPLENESIGDEIEAPELEAADATENNLEVEAPEVIELPDPEPEPEVIELPDPEPAPEVIELVDPEPAPEVIELPDPEPEPEVIELVDPEPAPEVIELPEDEGLSFEEPNGFAAEEVPAVESLEETVPVQPEEVVPFTVDQADDLSGGQEAMMGEDGDMMNMMDMDEPNDAAANNTETSEIENATLSNTPDVDQPELR